MNEDKTKFLQKAVENYLKCLTYGDKHDLRIFRLISLWFSNSSVQSVNALIEVPLCLFYRQYIDTVVTTVKKNFSKLFSKHIDLLIIRVIRDKFPWISWAIQFMNLTPTP
jgi:hypothetical protein